MRKKFKIMIAFFITGILGILCGIAIQQKNDMGLQVSGDKLITWVDFKIPCSCLKQACQIDIETYNTEHHIDWISLLAYAGAKTGGEFGKKAPSYITDASEQMQKDKDAADKWREKLSYYSYYYQAYEAVLGGMLGRFIIEETDENGQTQKNEKYGLKAFAPIAKGFPFSHYDDFGVSRSYGYKRQHLGHDMMGQIGTPIIAIESGYVEALGWNQYGGWRIGIRSNDHKRYYYYAHLRQNKPYAEGLKEGDQVTAGDVIGYMGHTGYSATENVNNIKTTHLHLGIQLIFDESQKECNSEIWIDCYQIVQFLQANQAEVIRNDTTKEWKRKYLLEEIPEASKEAEQKQEVIQN